MPVVVIVGSEASQGVSRLHLDECHGHAPPLPPQLPDEPAEWFAVGFEKLGWNVSTNEPAVVFNEENRLRVFAIMEWLDKAHNHVVGTRITCVYIYIYKAHNQVVGTSIRYQHNIYIYI